jgi:hypothetical protein
VRDRVEVFRQVDVDDVGIARQINRCVSLTASLVVDDDYQLDPRGDYGGRRPRAMGDVTEGETARPPGSLRTNTGNVSTLDDAVAAFNPL